MAPLLVERISSSSTMFASWKLRSACFALLISLPGLGAQLSPSVDYCTSNDGICSFFNDQSTKCSKEGGADYWECVCLSGYVFLNIK